MKTFKRYYELRSVIAGTTINTDYDSLFRMRTLMAPVEQEGGENMLGKETGKPGGLSVFNVRDSLFDKNSEDSVSKKLQDIAKAKFELAELFLYDLNRADSSEFYLNDAYQSSSDYDFKARVLFALASLYRNNNEQSKADDILHRIIAEYPTSSVTSSSKRLLNMSADEQLMTDVADSLY